MRVCDLCVSQSSEYSFHFPNWCRGRYNAWPILVSLLNHTTEARSCSAGKQLVALVVMPDREETPEEDYRFSCRFIYQSCLLFVLQLMGQYRNGFMLCPPGMTTVEHVVPRLALHIGDMKEQRLLLGVNSSHSVMCCSSVVIRRPAGTSGAVGTAEGSRMAKSETVDSATAARVAALDLTTEQPLGDSDRAGLHLDEADDDDDVTSSASTSTSMYNEAVHKALYGPCEWRSASARSELLKRFCSPAANGLYLPPVTGVCAARKEFSRAGLLPFLSIALEHPTVVPLLGGIPPFEHVVADEFHIVSGGASCLAVAQVGNVGFVLGVLCSSKKAC